MEVVNAWVNCNAKEINDIKLKIENEINKYIWSYLKPTVLVVQSSSQITISLEHNGDIQDEELLALCMFNISKIFNSCTIQIRTTEGDFVSVKYVPSLDVVTFVHVISADPEGVSASLSATESSVMG